MTCAKTCSIILAFLFTFCKSNTAQQHPLWQSGKMAHMPEISPQDDNRAAACAPATALRDLEWNNIDALIETGGSLWQDRANGRAHYFAPKTGDVGVLFAGALWLGGVSPDQQLKLAALQYRYSGNDYWPGPLSNDGAAEVNASTCILWDKFTVTLRSDAAKHRQYFECINNPNCDLEEIFPDGYIIPSYFQDYPAHGNVAQGQDYYISPFYDFDKNGSYDPAQGDYPWYDLTREIDCSSRTREDAIPLFGDQTYYWVFNDKGNIHSESQGQAIGMEIRAQAFAFSTNDEVNNMTFYNYVLINQGSQTLQETYFGTWIDLDIGGHIDDYVGCDVQRGLGYGYNGNAFDAPTALSFGYGNNPPAVGVDFFEGPYQDADNIDNPLTTDVLEAFEQKGIPYKGIGIGYGDSIIDNERFGMRKFLYHISGAANNGPPITAINYYNYLRGYWKNGQRMAYGGNALLPSSGADLDIPADYMFPGDTDPYHFGTMGIVTEPWTEVSSGNPASDRRFMQSAGPFTLEPGDYNNITVGVVYARATSRDPFDSVEEVRIADDKAQALFDNCFELVSGPDAPDVAVAELENEIILMWSNESPLSSNYKETYQLIDPTIPELKPDGTPYSAEERSYKFQGYMIYQLKNEEVSASELEDIALARLIAQCDIEDDISTIINFEKDAATGQVVGSLKVRGANQGIFHSLRITEDAFALGTKRLVNHKTYYFMILAYGYNNYAEFSTVTLSGQDELFLPSRKSALLDIPVIKGIPHKVNPQNSGTVQQSMYGQELALTQTEGTGNADRYIAITAETEELILADNQVENISYEAGASPVRVKVIDPLRVPAADFDLRLAPANQELDSDSTFWQLTNTTTGEIYDSKHTIKNLFEEILPAWGIAIEWKQIYYNEKTTEHFTALVDANIAFDNPSEPWLLGFPDDDGYTDFNWIRSGIGYRNPADGDPTEVAYNDYIDGATTIGIPPRYFTDAHEEYEGILGGTWAPFCLVSGTTFNTVLSEWIAPVAPTTKIFSGDLTPVGFPKYTSNIKGLNNVDVVFTSDKEHWTRCGVFEMQGQEELAQGNAEKLQLRKHASIDKNGIPSGQPGCNEAEATANGQQPSGMSWFPGYAIDLNTGERLNMAFGEDSWLAGENGTDMIWNPSSRAVSAQGEAVCGGQHWIYIFKNMRHLDDDDDMMPAYDRGEYLYAQLDGSGVLSNSRLKDILSSCTWVGSAIVNAATPLKSMTDGLIPGKAKISLRIAKPYKKFDIDQPDTENFDGAINWWNPVYTFSTRSLQTITGNIASIEDGLNNINIVPNPYYAFSSYEINKLDNRVKITNIPDECTITIYDLNGTVIRQFKKADPTTSLDWDLKNWKGIPIAGGTYIIHINIPNVGEKVLKWFGVMRPIDLDSF
jgi:hypothetical protein